MAYLFWDMRCEIYLYIRYPPAGNTPVLPAEEHYQAVTLLRAVLVAGAGAGAGAI